MRFTKELHIVSFSLVIVGALNWSLLALLNFNLVNALVGSWPGVERLVYVLVGAAAVYLAATHMQDCKICAKK